YSRFWHKFLYDIGVVGTPEPYNKRTSHGMILGENGEKMSKSKGNVINPDDIVSEYGADTLRVYEMFIGDFEKTAPWNTSSIRGSKRFLERVWGLLDIVTNENGYSPELETSFNKMIKKVTEDVETLKFNTAIASMMGVLNEIYSKGSITRGELATYIILLNPFAPHITEEMNERIGGKAMITKQSWPTYDPAKCVDSTVEIVVQISGKIKARLTLAADSTKEQAAAAAMALPAISEALCGKTIAKEIYVPGKLYNIVAK
ncbi:MAG: class I tRNA ligase family protein, partial [Angelakisella sp.]